MRKARLTWFRHVKRRCLVELVRSCENLCMPDFRTCKGRPKKIQREVAYFSHLLLV